MEENEVISNRLTALMNEYGDSVLRIENQKILM